MVAVIAIVGQSGSGKTTLLEGLIAELKRRGRRVGVVKHSHHPFDLDRQGKDSWRLFHAGAEVVAFSSPSRMAVVKEVKAEIPLEELLTTYLGDVDLALVEGYRGAPIPKIEVVRAGQEPLCPQEQLLAVVGEGRPGLQVPCFDPEDIQGLVGFLEVKVLQPASPPAASTF